MRVSMINHSISGKRPDSKGKFVYLTIRTDILQFVGYYTREAFELFLSGFKCQWDTIRNISFEIIRLFPNNLDFLTEEYRTAKILNPSKNILLQR